MATDYDYAGFLRDLAAAKVLADPAPKDDPNALHPDAVVTGDPLNQFGEQKPQGRPPSVVMRSPAHANMTVHGPAGALRIDPNGACRVHKDDAATIGHLAGMGFRKDDAEGVDGTMKAIRDLQRQARAKQRVMLNVRKLGPAAAALCSPDPARWLHDRARANEGRR
jgi:hypothetical protein